MSKDIHILLGHILESISIIHATLGDLGYDAFVESVPTQDAVIRRLEYIIENSLEIENWLLKIVREG